MVISSKISLLKQLAKYIPIDAQKRFYQGFILPLMDYGSITWGSTSKANVERLTKLQKRAARIILKTDIITPSFHMFRELKWSSIDDRVKYNKVIIAYKPLNDLTPSYISSLLKPMSEIHALNLRSSEYTIRTCRTIQSLIFLFSPQAMECSFSNSQRLRLPHYF